MQYFHKSIVKLKKLYIAGTFVYTVNDKWIIVRVLYFSDYKYKYHVFIYIHFYLLSKEND